MRRLEHRVGRVALGERVRVRPVGVGHHQVGAARALVGSTPELGVDHPLAVRRKRRAGHRRARRQIGDLGLLLGRQVVDPQVAVLGPRDRVPAAPARRWIGSAPGSSASARHSRRARARPAPRAPARRRARSDAAAWRADAQDRSSVRPRLASSSAPPRRHRRRRAGLRPASFTAIHSTPKATSAMASSSHPPAAP